jgi:glucose/arabinose dehydrogenase
MRLLLLIGLSVCLIGAPVAAQSAPPCQNRYDLPYVMQVQLCPEVILENFEAHGDLAAVSSLAFAPDGTLYFTSPARRAVYRLSPDEHGFFGAPQLLATLSEAPFGIAHAVDENAVYVAAEQSLFRITADGEVVRIFRDAQTLWHGELHIGADGRLYAARNTADGAAVISRARDGSDLRVVADNLRQVFGFTWHDQMLVIADAAESALYTVHNGALVRLAALPAHSAPHGIAHYRAQAVTEWYDSMLVALSGSWNAPIISGYAIFWLNIKQPSVQRQVIPDYFGLDADALARRRVSFHPFQLMSIAISAEGWLYTAIAEGRIYRFRPR